MPATETTLCMACSKGCVIRWLAAASATVLLIALVAVFLVSYGLNSGVCDLLQDQWVASPDKHWLAHARTEACGGAVSVVTSRIELAPYSAVPPTQGSIAFKEHTNGSKIGLVWLENRDLSVKGVDRANTTSGQTEFKGIRIRYKPGNADPEP